MHVLVLIGSILAIRMSLSLFLQKSSLTPGLSIKRSYIAGNGDLVFFQNCIVFRSHGALRVAYLCPTTRKVMTSSIDEFYEEAMLVYSDTRLRDFIRKYIGGYLTGSLSYLKECETGEEIEQNVHYLIEHPEKWQVKGDEEFMIDSEAFALYCTSKVKNEIKQQEVTPGDHIYVRAKKELLTTEHGIVIKLNRELRVACFSEESSTIVITSIEEFADGRRIGRADYPSKPVEEVLELAMTFVQNRQRWINNYHHNPNLRFAEYCKKRVTQPIPFFINFLKPGDHIFAKDEEEVYRNHGLYLGGGDGQRKVALFSAVNAVTSLDQFLQGCKLYWCNNPLPLLSTRNVFTMSKDDSRDRTGSFFHFISMSNLRPGDHIYAYRKLGVYQHHGIYIGTNREGEHMVVHFTGEKVKMKGGGISSSLSSGFVAGIVKETLEVFKGHGHILRLVRYGDSVRVMQRRRSGTTQTLESLPPQVVVAIAEYYAEHPAEWDTYGLVDNNCEMFALYCKTGIRITGRSQIQGYLLGKAKYKYLPHV